MNALAKEDVLGLSRTCAALVNNPHNKARGFAVGPVRLVESLGRDLLIPTDPEDRFRGLLLTAGKGCSGR